MYVPCLGLDSKTANSIYFFPPNFSIQIYFRWLGKSSYLFDARQYFEASKTIDYFRNAWHYIRVVLKFSENVAVKKPELDFIEYIILFCVSFNWLKNKSFQYMQIIFSTIFYTNFSSSSSRRKYFSFWHDSYCTAILTGSEFRNF